MTIQTNGCHCLASGFSVIYPILHMTVDQDDVPKIKSYPPAVISKLNVIRLEQAAFIVIENLDQTTRCDDILKPEHYVFVGTKINDEKLFHLGKAYTCR